MTFARILIANRGEIACRIAATARRLGIATVAVYSDADAAAKHVAACDSAVRLGPAAARDSYLQAERIIEAALATGAEAIHPGYGFLSENAAFAEAVAAAGLVFIGPPAGAIRAMGNKSAAKALMEKAGVPLVPGYHGQDQAPALLAAEAARIGYPVLIKASAGGGGKGMRIVEEAAAFDAALQSCQREARAAFGDDSVLVEKYLVRPRHIEVQVFADRHGECLALFERDCSVQRRHQKVLEEAPAPGMSDTRRAAMGAAACEAARAVGYEGAGTVEFIAGQDGTFFFMEMNTRLQVEHPVTEMITGFDLVEWQFAVAAGLPLPVRQSDLTCRGHALEARIYAENPAKGFLPATGVLERLRFPAGVEFCVAAPDAPDAPAAATEAPQRPAPVRIDSGVREGDSITPYYDPMIAKLIVWGEDRAAALRRMSAALAQTEVVGLASNVEFLARLVASAPFQAAKLDTGLIERHHAELFPEPQALSRVWLAIAVAATLVDEWRTEGPDPWSRRRGWRMNAPLVRQFEFNYGNERHQGTLRYLADGFEWLDAEGSVPLKVAAAAAGRIRLWLGETTFEGEAFRHGRAWHLAYAGSRRTVVPATLEPTAAPEAALGRLTAPMPGKIVALLATAGVPVAAGTPLVVMEAMKMEHTIAAPVAGTVTAFAYAVGDQVAEGAALLQFEPGAA